MAGQPKKRAMIAELSKRALDEYEDADAHLDYVVGWFKGGQTQVELVESINKELGFVDDNGRSTDEGITARMLSKYLNAKWPDTAGALLAGARREGAHGMVARRCRSPTRCQPIVSR